MMKYYPNIAQILTLQEFMGDIYTIDYEKQYAKKRVIMHASYEYKRKEKGLYVYELIGVIKTEEFI